MHSQPRVACRRCFCNPAGCRVLDIWLRGSVLTQAELYLQDSSGLRITRALPLVNAPAAGGVARLLGPDDIGWYRLQVK